MTKHEQIISMLPVELDQPIKIDASPVNEVTRIYSIGGSKKHGIWLRIGDGTWHKLEETDQNYEMVADAILNQLKHDNTLQS